jgi:Ca2+/Na+ antiporter
MGLTTLINPLHVSNESLWLNGSVFLITATLFFGYMITMKIGRLKGMILLLAYAIFLALTIITRV